MHVLALLPWLLSVGLPPEREPVDAVRCWTGVAGRGNVVVGPQRPWASVNPSPETLEGGSDGYDPGRPILGFGQLHVTGTGSFGKYGSFLVTPQVGLDTSLARRGSAKAEEQARITDYQVRLTGPDILCQMVPTDHAVLYRFTYPATDQAHLLVDLEHSIPGTLFKAGRLETGSVRIDPAKGTLQGWGEYWGGWSGESVRLYFAAAASAPVAGAGTWLGAEERPGQWQASLERPGRLGAFLRFRTAAGTPVDFKIAVSFSSVEKAQAYLVREIPGWDFEGLRQANRATWNRELGRITVEGGTEAHRTQFYTALYNAMRMPKDRTGDNPGWSSAEPYWDDHYCVWDSWKTTFPLHVLLHEGMVRDNIRAFLDRYRHNGQVQDAFIGGNDRFYKWIRDGVPEWLGNQGGDNVGNLLADAFAKGVKGIDWEAAYALVRDQAEHGRAPSYRVEDRGWIPYRTFAFGLPCSRTLEFATNDHAAAALAEGLGHAADAERYRRRSHGWEALWNPDAESDGFRGFLVPRRRDGAWVPFDPKQEAAVGSPGGVDRAFYQGSSWVYSQAVPHDMKRLIALCGGPETYVRRLGHALSKGLVDLSNEPSFLTPFGFLYAGRPDLTSLWVRRNLEVYTLDAYPGDEDGGAMSSWFVFAALGLFPNAGQDLYLLHGPLFPKATLRMENGRVLTIEGVGASPGNPYVQSLTVDGRPWDRAWIRHGNLRNGATLRFVMGPKPSAWGRSEMPE